MINLVGCVIILLFFFFFHPFLLILLQWYCCCLHEALRRCKIGLNSDAIKALPIVSHQSLSSSSSSSSVQDECCICLDKFENSERVKVLPSCNHCYHPLCVDKWLTAHSTCPLCRASVKPVKPQPNDTVQIVVQWPPTKLSLFLFLSFLMFKKSLILSYKSYWWLQWMLMFCDHAFNFIFFLF